MREHLGVREHLLLKVANLALFVAGRTFYWPKVAIVLVDGANRHIVETAVGYARHTHFYVACWHILRLARALLLLLLLLLLLVLTDYARGGDLVRVMNRALFDACGGLDRLFSANAVTVIASLLQLL